MTRTPFIFGGIAGIVMAAGSLSAQSALKDVPRIVEGIIAVGIAYEITQQCDDLSPRYFRANSFVNGLKSHARQLGFSDAQIDAWVDDQSEQKRLEAIARQRLADKGAVVGQPATYCAVGEAEIAQGSPIGRLMR